MVMHEHVIRFREKRRFLLCFFSALVTVHISSVPVFGRVRPTEIKNCLSYRNVYTMFTSCAIEALYDELSDMAFELDKETLNRTSFLNLIGNWCR